MAFLHKGMHTTRSEKTEDTRTLDGVVFMDYTGRMRLQFEHEQGFKADTDLPQPLQESVLPGDRVRLTLTCKIERL